MTKSSCNHSLVTSLMALGMLSQSFLGRTHAFLSTTSTSTKARQTTVGILQSDHRGYSDRFEENVGYSRNYFRDEPNPYTTSPLALRRDSPRRSWTDAYHQPHGNQWNPMPDKQKGCPMLSRSGSDVQGGSRRTFSDPYGQSGFDVEMRSRPSQPMHADMQVWDGPTNTPQRMSMYTEDGYARPLRTSVAPSPYSNGLSTSIDNRGQLEFPMEVQMANGMFQGRQYGRTQHSPVDGGSLKTFNLDASIAEVEVTLETNGQPLMARVELWQGPSSTKTVAEVQVEDGKTRPFSVVIPTPGHGSILRIQNKGTMEFPLKAYVREIQGPMVEASGQHHASISGSQAGYRNNYLPSGYGNNSFGSQVGFGNKFLPSGFGNNSFGSQVGFGNNGFGNNSFGAQVGFGNNGGFGNNSFGAQSGFGNSFGAQGGFGNNRLPSGYGNSNSFPQLGHSNNYSRSGYGSSQPPLGLNNNYASVGNYNRSW